MTDWTKARVDYLRARRAAWQRGHRMLFTFEDWVAWWEEHLGPNWQQKRGRGRGKYQMARIGDRGHYKRGNVRCVTWEENIAERREKLTEDQARAIYVTEGAAVAIAERFGVKRGTVVRIKNGETWKRATAGLQCAPLKRGRPCVKEAR